MPNHGHKHQHNMSMPLITRYLRRQVFLAKEEDDDVTRREIFESTQFKGYNLWILSFSMVLASVGLITNSLTAIIGAMIISPLMGPVFAFAYALAIRDVELKRASVYNWIWMILVSLASSAVFFLINPFGHTTPLIDSFTKATFFDIMLAFFGGMAGFVGLMKKEGTKIIAGVAVATACMPPLCTASFGLAHGDLEKFLGGLYFFFINCLFIGWGTYFLARFIYPHKRRENKVKQNLLVVWLWNIFTVLVLVPAVIITFDKWNSQAGVNLETKGEKNEDRIIVLEKKIAALDSTLHLMKEKGR